MQKVYFNFFLFPLFLVLIGCRNYTLSSEQEKLINIKNVSPDSSIMALYHPYKIILDEKMNVPIGKLDTDLIKEKPESNLGNLCAHIALTQTRLYLKQEIDFAILNYGGLRVPSIAKGTTFVAQAVAEATREGAYSLIGGGDSVAAINQAGLDDEVS